MTYGNMSWHEYGQIGVDRARDLVDEQRDKAIEWAREENSKLKEKLKESEQVNQVLKARAENNLIKIFTLSIIFNFILLDMAKSLINDKNFECNKISSHMSLFFGRLSCR